MVSLEKAILFFSDNCLATNEEIKDIKKLAAQKLEEIDKNNKYLINVFEYMKDNPYEDDDKFYLYLKEIESELSL